MGSMCLLINTLICANSALLNSTLDRILLFFSFIDAYRLIAKNYPSEILEGRLYLGDQFHTQDKQIMKHLKITHILNVSDMIPNYFEDSSNILIVKTITESLKVEYLRINIGDYNDVQIRRAFPIVYRFI